MGLVSDVISLARLGLNDTSGARWGDSDYLKWLRVAIQRIDGVLYRNNIEFFQKEHGFSTVVGQAEYDLPSDFGSPMFLSRDDTHYEIKLKTKQQWRTIISAAEACHYIVKANSSNVRKLFLKGTPTSVYGITLDYYPETDTSTLATTDNMPYGGKMDNIIADYLKIVALNSDEHEVSQDLSILQDLENNVLQAYSSQTPLTITRRGWNSGTTDA